MLSIPQCTSRLRHCSRFAFIKGVFAHSPKIFKTARVAVRNPQLVRTLFELHAGRRDYEPPADLWIDESLSILSGKNDLPRATSKDLIEALGPIGAEYETPKHYVGSIDLSYTDAATAVLNRREARRQVEANFKVGRDEKWGLHPKDILVDFLRYVNPVLEYVGRSGESDVNSELDIGLLKVFNRPNELYLKKRGWDVTHLMDWAWILSANTTERAAARLACIGRLGLKKTQERKSLPHFMPTFLLRRQAFTAPALRTVLNFIWDYMAWISEQKARTGEKQVPNQISKHDRSKQVVGMKEFGFMLIVVRLLRKARRVMPAACESIAALLCRHLDDCLILKDEDGRDDAAENRLAALTFMYNSALALVASPTFLRPFRSATHQQRAQFLILRKMTQYTPPLLVDRRGYRAVTRVQLMQKKTSREREWAHFKALSWPPWKENRLGIDADIGPELGISQAKEVLNQAKEAGYAADDWDDAASILTGWDTDDSPTIQTRMIFKGIAGRPDQRVKSMVWAARIRATRTLQEAWAAFLSYEDSGIEKLAFVYHAMFEKLFFDHKRTLSDIRYGKSKMESEGVVEPLPGDGPEVYPAPTTPNYTVYNRIPPPSIDEFTQRMIDHGIKPKARGGLLNMLLRNAPTLAAGIRFLKASNLRQEHINALLIQPTNTQKGLKTLRLLNEVPANLFVAVIDLLARFPFAGSLLERKSDVEKLNYIYNGRASEDGKDLQIMQHSWGPASQAIWLVLERQPRERAPWYSVLAVLARTGVVSPLESRSESRSYSAVANWKASCLILNVMEELDIKLDLAAMKILCTGLEKAIFEAVYVINHRNGKENLEDGLRADLERVLDMGLPRVKQIFKDIVRSGRMQQDIPQSILESQDQGISAPDMGSGDAEVMLSDEKNDFDNAVEDLEDGDVPSSYVPYNYLPPACLIPRLLEVPDTAQLHSFIRILGLRRDYQGILDLIEWMALYSDEIRVVMEEQQNGSRMMRRCMTAVRVFLERSWLYYHNNWDEQIRLNEMIGDINPAPLEIWQNVRNTILDVQYWGGWPTDDEVERYCMKGRFL